MSDRGLPIVDGAPACPFVAFEDDRDERAASPDHRHRCYAEIRPAPRALAHQEAYCLASAFPVCPTFQDWARREAAHARQGATAAAVPPTDPEPARRNPPRDWTAPPPWLASDEAPEGVADDERGDGGAPAPGFLADRGGDVDRDERGTDRGSEPVDWATDRADLPRESVEGQGLAGSRADRMASGSGLPEAAPVAAAAGGARGSRHDEPRSDDEDADAVDDWADDDELDARAQSDGGSERGRGDRRPRAGDSRRRDGGRGPSWEQPRRYEAYPTIRTRVGMPGLPRPGRVALMAVALVLAAIGLFFLPQLLPIGGSEPGTGAVSPSPSTGPSASAEPSPTAPPAPTPQVYVVKSGDTLSKIARRFGVTLDELIAANRETLPNPDKLAIGDAITIPAPGAGSGASPSSDEASTAP